MLFPSKRPDVFSPFLSGAEQICLFEMIMEKWVECKVKFALAFVWERAA
jgi:hypothetical protein